jgi:hypothetical protein
MCDRQSEQCYNEEVGASDASAYHDRRYGLLPAGWTGASNLGASERDELRTAARRGLGRAIGQFERQSHGYRASRLRKRDSG